MKANAEYCDNEYIPSIIFPRCRKRTGNIEVNKIWMM
jgi:hypothetical protein